MASRSIQEALENPDPRERARAITGLLSEYQATVAELARLRRETVADLRSHGLTQAQVAEVLGVSPGRISQVEKEKSEPPQVPEKATHVLVKRAIPTESGTRASHSLFLVETETQGITPDRKMLQVGPIPAPHHIAIRLGIKDGDMAVIRSKLMFANDIPVRLSNSWFTVEVAKQTGLYESDFIPEGLQVLFERFHHRFGHAVESLTARLPTPKESELLQIALDSPIVHILRSSYNTENVHIHTLESICAAEKHVFDVRQTEGDSIF